MILGVDPGIQFTGVAAIERGAWVASARLRGVAGAGKDWALCARTARRLAGEVNAWVLEHDPARVAIETMVDQGPARNAYRWRHTTAACCQALHDAAEAGGWADLIVWQDAAAVLRHNRGGYGTLAYLLQQGRAGPGVGAPGPLDEHQASAMAHAAYCETTWRSQVAGG
jgi:hypothetical protein